MNKIIVLIIFIFTGNYLSAQSILAKPLPMGSIQVFPQNIKWMDAPTPFLPGAKMIVLEGNPKKEGVFTVRFKLPPNYTIPAHWHPKDERVTIISGSLYLGFGEQADKTSGTKFTAGAYYVNPAMSHHFLYTLNEEVILQITGIGPWGITMLDEK